MTRLVSCLTLALLLESHTVAEVARPAEAGGVRAIAPRSVIELHEADAIAALYKLARRAGVELKIDPAIRVKIPVHLRVTDPMSAMNEVAFASGLSFEKRKGYYYVSFAKSSQSATHHLDKAKMEKGR